MQNNFVMVKRYKSIHVNFYLNINKSLYDDDMSVDGVIFKVHVEINLSMQMFSIFYENFLVTHF